MSDAAPPGRGDGPGPNDSDYHWPFGPQADDHASTWTGSGATEWGQPNLGSPAPAPVPRRPRLAAVVGVVALTAVMVGGGAGYVGARIGGSGDSAVPVGSASSTTEPGGGASSPAPVPSGQTVSAVEVAQRLLPSTVMIEVGNSTGSGFVLDRSGHVMTNNHVVAAASTGEQIRVVFSDGHRTAATLVGRSPSYDLAVIQVKASSSLRPVQTGDSSSAQVGEPVIAVGSPLGLPGTVTQGIVSAVNRPLVVNESSSADAPTAYIDGIQTDAPINPGNSGGPLVDPSARVIGVNSAILSLGSAAQDQAGSIGIGFAIPVNQAKVIGQMLIDRGKATYPVIGASVSDTTSGIQLRTVESTGPAGKGGLRAGDVVTKIDDVAVDSSTELIVSVRTHRPGDTVTLTYSRGSTLQTARVVLGSKEG